jgi:hypothetical protein
VKPFVFQARQQAYAEILRWGLLAIREAAYAGKTKLCEIESDHIHNLPDLLNEANEARHHCYIGQERSYYVDRLKELGDEEYLAERTRIYGEPWKVLAALAMDELQPNRDGRTAAG